jgi:hypothetical protein
MVLVGRMDECLHRWPRLYIAVGGGKHVLVRGGGGGKDPGRNGNMLEEARCVYTCGGQKIIWCHRTGCVGLLDALARWAKL